MRGKGRQGTGEGKDRGRARTGEHTGEGRIGKAGPGEAKTGEVRAQVGKEPGRQRPENADRGRREPKKGENLPKKAVHLRAFA